MLAALTSTLPSLPLSRRLRSAAAVGRCSRLYAQAGSNTTADPQWRHKSSSSSSISGEGNAPFYISTPIYYVNGDPHLGHAYTSATADMVARYQRKSGRDVLFVTGTDEHGQKVQQSAESRGMPPQALADENSGKFYKMTQALGCSHTDFVRTTQPRHKQTVAALWTVLQDKGYIYSGVYEGWYSVRDEAFYSADELLPTGLAPTGAEVKWVKEESYFFKLSAFTQPLLDHYGAGAGAGAGEIQPKSALNEVIAFLEQEGGLRDLCISRSTFEWGVPVPGGPGHVVYVWLDALANYLTAVGYGHEQGQDSPAGGSDTGGASASRMTMMDKYWPVDVHIVGKDIIRFHCIYWPAFLLAAELPLPQKVFAHGWWTQDGEKMSKSLGNVLDPTELLQRYGRDYVRYFLASEIPYGKDGDFSHQAMVLRCNSFLANDLGNLTQRVMVMLHKHCGGLVPQPAQTALPARQEPGAPGYELGVAAAPKGLLQADLKLLRACTKAIDRAHSHMSNLALKPYCDTILSVAAAGNRYIDANAPWTLYKAGDIARMHTVLYTLTEVLRRVSVAMEPVIPDSSQALLMQLGATSEQMQSFASVSAGEGGRFLAPGTVTAKPTPIFPRLVLDMDKE